MVVDTSNLTKTMNAGNTPVKIKMVKHDSINFSQEIQDKQTEATLKSKKEKDSVTKSIDA